MPQTTISLSDAEARHVLNLDAYMEGFRAGIETAKRMYVQSVLQGRKVDEAAAKGTKEEPANGDAV
jgi:hypothetical protein